MAYGPFKNVYGGENNTIKGMLPLEGQDARGFRYMKSFTLAGSVPSNKLYKTYDISWKVRIRDSGAQDEDGKYTGAILFEQKVTIPAFVFGSGDPMLPQISWLSPNDGVQETTICDGQSFSVISSLQDLIDKTPALEEYGLHGAWQKLDVNKARENESGTVKYGRECGFPILQNQVGVSFGDYYFFGEWYSKFYECEIPDGAFLEVVNDGWTLGKLKTITYKIAWEEAENSNKAPFFVHPAGFHVSALKNGTATVVESWTKISDKKTLSTIPNTSPISIYRLENGEINFAGKDASGTAFSRSHDDGKTWKLMGRPFDSSFKIQDCQPIFGPLDMAIATKGGQLHVLNSSDGGVKWTAPKAFEPVTLPSGVKTLSLRQRQVHGEVTLIVTDGISIQLESKDDGATWSVIS